MMGSDDAAPVMMIGSDDAARVSRREHLTGVVLAGGQSRRFGSDKAAFQIGGRPMIERVHAALQCVTSGVLLSVGTHQSRTRPPLPTVIDEYPDCGPLAGMHAAMKAAPTPRILVVACDLPFISPGVLRRIAVGCGDDADAAVARTPDGRLQPLCASYRSDLWPLAESFLQQRRLSVLEWLGVLDDVRVVDVPQMELRNINRPSDLNFRGTSVASELNG